MRSRAASLEFVSMLVCRYLSEQAEIYILYVDQERERSEARGGTGER